MLDAFRKDGIATPQGRLGGSMIANGLQNLAVLAGFVEALGKQSKGGRKKVVRG